MKVLIKFIVFGLVVLLICNCASYKLNNTVWVNVTSVEEDGVKGNVVTSLYFMTDSTVNIYKSVIVDTNIVVDPFFFANGFYKTSGNPKKEANIEINAKTTEGQSTDLKFKGFFRKDKAIVIVSQDSVAKIFGYMPSVKLQNTNSKK